MTTNRGELLECLPPYRNEWRVIKDQQYVPDIMQWIVRCHQLFRDQYDLISAKFLDRSVEKVCAKLFDFCKKNIRYREETVKSQTVAVPGGILTRGYGDCKHYALFCGGVLDSLKRGGLPVDWCYYFASYNGSKDPYHVFVCVYLSDGELWLDPTPGAGTKDPTLLVKENV